MSNFFSLPTLPGPVAGILTSILTVWGYVWWFVLPLIAGIVLWEAWLLHLHYQWAHNIHWSFLEIRIPKNVLKTPRAMEQIFAAAHAPYSYGYSWVQKYIQGMDEYWFSFEIIARNGETHFYLRTPNALRNMMESAIYGQYPEAEISEADDYLEEMPKALPNRTFDLAGFEEVLRDPGYVPIRTYESFEDAVEERRVDPIAGLMEIMSKLKEGEQLWYQLLVRPTGDEFRKEGADAIDELHGLKKEEHHGSWFPKIDLGFTFSQALRAPFQHPGEHEAHEERKEEGSQRMFLPVHQQEWANAVQKKIQKLAFDATVRFMVITERDVAPADSGHLMSLHGFVRQFNSPYMNQLKPEKSTTTAGWAVKGLFKKTRLQYRKRLLYEHYRNILLGPTATLNIEELATIYHFPIAAVSTAELEKVESRKGSPPAALPIIEEE
ncbi:MAG TPA: hypothetical protein VMU07_00050 [Candidatus Paceibacterota bacterium]|nr:hypothetical protein [Candidatus Paceibacterota bacterium]